MVEGQKPLGIYTHIEKTAGVSALDSFQRAVNGPVYMYSPRADRFVNSTDTLYSLTSPWIDFAREAVAAPYVGAVIANVYANMQGVHQRALRVRYPELVVPQDAALITGHFVADQFDGLLHGRQAVRGVMLRDPLARMISQFNYWCAYKGGHDWRVPVPFPGTADLEGLFYQYALLPGHKNFQTQALGHIDIRAFDVVGITDEADDFIMAYLQKLEMYGVQMSGRANIQRVKHMNVNRAKPVIQKGMLDKNFVSAFEAFHNEDYSLYETAKELWADSKTASC